MSISLDWGNSAILDHSSLIRLGEQSILDQVVSLDWGNGVILDQVVSLDWGNSVILDHVSPVGSTAKIYIHTNQLVHKTLFNEKLLALSS